ncbi:hypothetical protein Tco_1196989 [Tanacetum coccineum]
MIIIPTKCNIKVVPNGIITILLVFPNLLVPISYLILKPFPLSSDGARFMRLWAGDINTGVLPLAILHQPTQNDTEQQQQQQQQHPIPPEQGMGEVVKLQKDTISIYRCHISRIWRSCFFVEPSVKSISKEKNSIIDVKLSLNEIWILRRDGVVLHNLSDLTESGECNFFGSLEPVVAKQLSENSEHDGTDPFWLINLVFPSAKEASRDPRSFVYCWKKLCSRYFHNWCHENAPCSLLLDSSNGVIGLIRKSPVSLLRRLRDT